MFSVYSSLYGASYQPNILFAGAGSQQQNLNGSLTQDGLCDGHIAGKQSKVPFRRHRSDAVCY